MSIRTRQTQYNRIRPKERLPEWIRPSLGTASELEKVQGLVKQYKIHTICEEGRCPNRGECYAAGTATFLLGGSICTRSCAFCQVEKGLAPNDLDKLEAQKIATVISQLNLNYVVLTSVARDDLPDHGASLFTETMQEIRELIPNISIEILTPDFWGGSPSKSKSIELQRDRIAHVLSAKPVCFNHNLETVERLQKEIRRGATYISSLRLLKLAHDIAPNIPTKSGLMLGLGEKEEEIIQTMKDLRKVQCKQITIGQYLRPSLAHIPVQKYWTPQDFNRLGAIAKELGFRKVSSGPLIRSSYHAKDN